MSLGLVGRLWTRAPAAEAPAVNVLRFPIASSSFASTKSGDTRVLASLCIWRRFGFEPNRQDLGSVFLPSGPTAASLKAASSRNQETSVHLCRVFSNSILSGLV